MMRVLAMKRARDRQVAVFNGNSGCSLICGNNQSILKRMGSKSFDLVITSPPYFSQREYPGLGLGGDASLDEYLENIFNTFRQLVRVTKPTGSIVYNMGDKIVEGSLQLVPYRFAIRALEDPQLNVRLINDITWLKKNPTPHQFSRRLTNSTEPFFHFALGRDYYYDRAAFLPGQEVPPPTVGKKLGSQYRKLIDTSELVTRERRAAHRALDNVIAEVKNGKIHGFRMKIRGIHAPAYGGHDGGRKAELERDGFTVIRISGRPLKRDVIESPVARLPGGGPVRPPIFPVQVIREFIRMLCPPGGEVLDPYMGSGSTVAAALLEDRKCTGIEINAEYFEAAAERIAGEIADCHSRNEN